MSTLSDTLRDSVTRILHQITFHHSDIQVHVVSMGNSGLVSIQVHRADMSRVLGKKGVHFRALTEIIKAIGDKYRIPLNVELLEPEVGQNERYLAFSGTDDWPAKEVKEVTQMVAGLCFSLPVTVELQDHPGFKTVVTIRLSEGESVKMSMGLQPHFGTLWNAMGKANGRYIYVDVVHPSLKNSLMTPV
jgi:predicted RNA-binding protein YlqC (UPF0109 family)